MVKLPVAVEQVGCVTMLNVGCAGVAGCAFTITLEDGVDVQAPKVAVTV